MGHDSRRNDIRSRLKCLRDGAVHNLGQPAHRRGTAAHPRLLAGLQLSRLGMIYLVDNPLLREPLRPEQIKNRLLGHWGSSPGLAFIYTHLNRAIKQYDLDMIFLAGPGHGAPGRTRTVLSRRHLLRNLPAEERRPRTACASSSKSFRSLAELEATALRKLPDRSMKAASWGTSCRTPAAPHSIIPN